MADISLLFDVAGGTSIDKGSGKLIKEQLAGIIDNINASPLQIKVQADETSLQAFGARIQEITSSIGSVKAINLDSAELVSGMRSVAQIATTIGDATETWRNMDTTLGSISEDLAVLQNLLTDITRALPRAGSALERMATADSSGLDDLIRKLEELRELIVQINDKNFSVTNVFEYKKGSNGGTEELELYRTRALETLRVVNMLSDEMSRVSNNAGTSAAFAKALTTSGEFNNFRSLSEKFKGSDYYTGEIAGASTVVSLNKIIGLLNEYMRVYGAILTQARSGGVDTILPDTSGLDRAIQQIEAYDARAKAVEKTFTDAAKAAAGLNAPENTGAERVLQDSTSQANRVRELCTEISGMFDALRSKILETFDFATVPMDISSIKSVIEQIKTEFDGIEIRVGAGSTGDSGSTKRRGGSGGRKKNTDPVKAEEEAAWKSYLAWQEAEEKKQAEIEESWLERQSILQKEEAAIEAAARKEIEAYEKVEDAREKAAEKAALEAENARQREVDAAEKAARVQEAAAERAAKEAEVEEIRRLNLLKQSQDLLNSMQSKQTKWSGASEDDIVTIKAYVTGLSEAREQFDAGTLSADDFQMKLLELKNRFAEYVGAVREASEDTSVLTKGTQAHGAALQSTERLLRTANDALAKYTAAKDGKSDVDYKKIESYASAINELRNRLVYGTITQKEFNDEISVLRSGITGSITKIKEAGEATLTWSERYGNLTQKFAEWFSVARVVSFLYQQMIRMVNSVVELDTAMTELRKVTDEADAAYDKFLENAATRTKALGASLTDVVTSTADFARLGYSIEEAEKMADAAIVYKNVGDGIEDINQASESIIATMQAFGIEASSVMSIVDKFNMIGNKFAISSGGVGEALLRSAAAMKSAGNTIDETVALVAAANTIVQNPDTVGTTLKTISMYLRAAKTEAEEAGESTDGMASSVSELRQKILDLTGQKVDIQIDESTFKGTYQILKELSSVFDTLSDTSKANILEMIGGKRNANVVAALLENFSIAEEALAVSAESAGSALKENEKVLESIQGKLNILAATFESLSSNVLDSELVKVIIDVLAGILSFTDGVITVIDYLGGLQTILLAIVSILAISHGGLIAYKTQLFAISAEKHILNFFLNLKDGLSNIVLTIPNAITAWKAYKAEMISFSAAMQASIPVIGLLITAVTLITAGISAYNRSQEKARQKAIEAADSASTLSDEIGSLVSSYKSLTEAVKNDESAKASLIQTQDELIEKLNLEDEELDRLIQKYGSYEEALKRASVSDLRIAERDLQAGVNAQTEELLDAAKAGRNNLSYIDATWKNKDAELNKQALDALIDAGYVNRALTSANGFSWVNTEFDLSSTDGVIRAYERLGEMIDIVTEAGYGETAVFKALYNVYGEVTTSINDYRKSVKALNKNLAEQFGITAILGNELPATADEFKVFRQSIIDAAIATGRFDGSTKDIESAIDSVLSQQPEFIGFLNEISTSATNTEEILGGSSSELVKIASSYYATISLLKDALKEYEEAGTVSAETYNALLNSGYELEDLFKFTSDGIELQTDSLESSIDKVNEETGAKLINANATEANIAAVLRFSDSLRQEDDAVEVTLDSIKELVDMETELREGVEYSSLQMLEILEQYPELSSHIEETTNGYKIEANAIQDLVKAKAELYRQNKKELALSARTALVDTRSYAKAADVTDEIFADYFAETGKQITTLDQYAEAYAKRFPNNGGLAGVAEEVIEYAEALIEMNSASDVIDDIVSGNMYQGYNPEDENKKFDEDEETAFEREYKRRQHLLNMDKLSVAEYLAWLRSAYQASYAAGEMELDDYYSYKEEVYEKEKELFADSIADVEHQIELLNNAPADNTEAVTALYRQLQERVHEQAEYYRSQGLDDNHSLIQELQNQWWSYEQEIARIRSDVFDNYLTESKHSIDTMRIDGADATEVLNSWKVILSRINEEIEYYSGIGGEEARDSVRSLLDEAENVKQEMLDYIKEFVTEANDTLDGLQNAYTTFTVAAKEYASTGALAPDTIQSIIELGPKYLEYLYDENGQLTLNKQVLQEVIAAKTEELAVENALAYARQVLHAAEQNDMQLLVSLTDASASASNATWDMAYATLGLAKAVGTANGMDVSYFDDAADYIAKMQSLAKTATSTMSSYFNTLEEGYVSQADGLKQILKLTQDLIKWENEQQIEALEEQKNDYADIIDQKKEMLAITKEQVNRERSLSDKLEEIAKLQAQISQLSLDDSRGAQAEKRTLEAELAELQKELANEQYDYSIEVSEEALDKELEDFEQTKDDEIKALEDMLGSAEKLYQAAIERIDSDWEGLYADLLYWNENYGSTLQADLISAWDAASEAVQRYGSFVEALEGVKGNSNLGDFSGEISGSYGSSEDNDYTSASSLLSSMKRNSLAWFTADSGERADIESAQRDLAAQWEELFGERLTSRNGSWYRPNGDLLYRLTDDEVGTAIVKEMEKNADAWHTATGVREQNALVQRNEELAELLEQYLGQEITKTSDGVWWLGNRKLFDVYHNGGVVGGSPTLKQNEVLAIIEDREIVLDDQKENTLYRIIDFVSVLSEKLGKALDPGKISQIFGGASSVGATTSVGEAVRKKAEEAISSIRNSTSSYTIEHIEVTAPVQVVQRLDDEEIRHHANTIGAVSAEYIKEGFTKRGIRKGASLI